jgi:tetratricopeptide (TPR) repeat protein
VPEDLAAPVSEAYGFQGVLLLEQAQSKQGTEREQLLQEAAEKFEAVLRIKPNHGIVLNNWGSVLIEQARMRQGTERERFLQEAVKKCEAALRSKPDFEFALNGCGAAIYEQARLRLGVEREHLLQEAVRKFEAALQIDPTFNYAIKNWGGALIEQAKLRDDKEVATSLFATAEEYLLDAETLAPGIAAYHLACLNALRDQEEKCREWLEKGRSAGTLLPREYMLGDDNLAGVRDRQWFKEFLANL